MNIQVKTKICAVSLALLAGCGGGGGSSSVTSDDTPAAAVSYAGLTDELTDLQTKYTGATRASLSDINSAANATYTGVVAGTVGGDGLAGELTVNADFGAGTATASATNFVHEVDGAYAGTLTDPIADIQPSATVGSPQFTANLEGDLTNGGNTHATTIALDGDFVSDGTDPVAGITGFADGLVDGEFFSGDFAAEK